MLGVGGIEMLLLLAMMGGGDLQVARLVPAAEYFKAREIEPTTEKLIELAGQTPDSPKKQLQQLLALRQLGAELDTLKKSAKAGDFRRLLTAIAQGRTAADATGFAAEYARRVLDSWDNAKPETPPVRAWREGLRGLPQNATVVGVMQVAAARSGESKLFDIGPLLATLPPQGKEEMFAVLEKVGNFRVDRVAYAFVEPAGMGNYELIARVSGRGNAEWIAKLFPAPYKLEVREGTEPIRILTSTQPGPAVAILGNSDLVIAGSLPRGADKEDPAKHLPVLERYLASLAKGEPGPMQGPLKEDLVRVPTRAASLTVGSPPAMMREGQVPFPMPDKIVLYTQPIAGGLDLQFQARLSDEAKAKSLLQFIGQGRDAGLKQLALLQGKPLPLPGINLGPIVNMLESIQLQTNGSTMELRMVMPEDALIALPMSFLAFRVAN